MASQMVFFAVMRRGCAVGVRGKFMELSCSLMRFIWHCVVLALRLQNSRG
jgi:hypothetical protein